MLSFLAKTATKAADARSVLMLDLASASMPCISLYTQQNEHVTLEWFSAIINDSYFSMKNYHNASGQIGQIGQI